jgi:hypothetical protein
MHYLAATLHTLGVHLRDRATAATTTGRDRGSVTIQEVLWAVFAIAIVGIVVPLRAPPPPPAGGGGQSP